MSRYKKRFPLDVLVISEHAHMGASSTYGILKHLGVHPAVRSYGVVPDFSNEKTAMAFVDGGTVNTIIIDPCSVLFDAEPFISRIRNEWPNIVFVLYTYPKCREEFCNAHPRFLHYFYLDYIQGFQEEGENIAQLTRDNAVRVDNILTRCEEWHKTRFQYDVGISFAGEDRKYAEELATHLSRRGVSVFYDAYEQADLLGKNLFTHLHEVYSKKCRYCAMLISEAYANKLWTSHERIAAQERTLRERGNEYILPIRLDDTAIPGMYNVVAYVRIEEGTSKIADLIAQKLWITRPLKKKKFIGETLY